MNAMSSIASAVCDDPWQAGLRSAQLWRATVIDTLARGEAIVSETLVVLASDAGRGKSIKLNRLLGQRLDELEKALKPSGPFGAEGKSALAKLTAFRKYEAHRAALCHGIAKVSIDDKRHWVLLIKLLSLGPSGSERIVMTFEQREAAILLAEIENCCQQLSCALGQVRAFVTKPAKQGPMS